MINLKSNVEKENEHMKLVVNFNFIIKNFIPFIIFLYFNSPQLMYHQDI